MQLLRYSKGKYNTISMQKFANQKLTQHEVEECIRRNINMDGSISSLCLDFSGGYVPLVSEDEVRLTAALLCTYHNSLIQEEAVRPWPAEASLHDSLHDSLHGSLHDHDGSEGYPEQAYEDPAAQDEYENSGVSDDEDEKERLESLAFEFEINADIDGEPNFGKAGMEHHLW